MVSTRALNLLILILVALPVSAATRTLNLFEWSATAPIVVQCVVVGEVGKYTMVRAETVFRGEIETGDDVLIDVKESNRSRLYQLHKKALRLELDTTYFVLLEPSRRGR